MRYTQATQTETLIIHTKFASHHFKHHVQQPIKEATKMNVSAQTIEPVYKLNAVMCSIEVYTNKVVIKPKLARKWQHSHDIVIPLNKISNVQISEPSFFANGFVFFDTSKTEQSKPMTAFQAANEKNAFVFRKSQREGAFEIYSYVDEQKHKAPELTKEETFKTEKSAKNDKSPILENTKTNPYKPLPSRKEDFADYKKLTDERDWAGIFSFNGANITTFGVKKELNVLHTYLAENEVVFAMATGVLRQTGTSNASDFGNNTWIAVLTDKRVLFLDHALMTSSVDTQSIRHEKIQAVSASQGWALGKIIIDIGSRCIIIDNCQKKDVQVFAELANDWLEYKEQQQKNKSEKTDNQNFAGEIQKLADLKSAGFLTEEEFTIAKAKILQGAKT
jgi:hypothetical protein